MKILESLTICKLEDREKVSQLIIESAKETNEIVKLTEEITTSQDWGINYAECH